MQVSKYENYKNVIDLGVLQRTNMMITIFNKPVKKPEDIRQYKYFNKFEFFIAILKIKITGYKKNYCITFPKHLYEHNWKNGKLYRKYMKRKMIEENAYEN